MINHANRYADACRAAATIQGLDPLTAAANARAVELAEAGVSYDVEQTGGFTMVACFYLPYSRCDECGTPMDGAGDEGCEGCGGRREGGDVITCTHARPGSTGPNPATSRTCLPAPAPTPRRATSWP
jgi:hypothetical protein